MADQSGYERLTGSREPEVPGGGIPLPGAFHGILYYLLNNGGAATEEILVKIAREAVGELHENRMEYVWGSWEAFTRDLLDQLQDRGLVSRGVTGWVLDPEFRGGRVKVMYFQNGKRELRVTVRSKEEYEARELLAKARARVQAYQAQLEAWGLYTGRIKITLDRHMNSLRWEDELDKEDAEPPVPVTNEDLGWSGDRSYGGASKFTRAYLESQYPRWIPGSEVATAFNELNPHLKPLSRYQPFERLATLVRKGLAERQDEVGGKGKGRPKTLFRWKPPPGQEQ